MEGENMRKIPLKNYFILAAVIILSGIVVIYVANMYKNKKDYEKENTMSFLKEIYAKDFENFVIENPDSIVYISDASDETLEVELKNYIIEKDYIQDIVYIDANKINIDFVNILKKYSSLISNKIPNVLIIKGSKIINIFYAEEDTTASQIIDFMGLYYND